MTKAEINKLATHPLQTSYWGEFRQEWGNEVLYTKHGLLTLHKLPFINYKIGNLIKGNSPTKKMLDGLKEIALEHNLIFIKLEPNVGFRHPELAEGSRTHVRPRLSQGDSSTHARNDMVKLLQKNGAVRGKTLFTPSTFQIDLTRSEGELMKSFNSKTRYNIRLAQRKGVTVEVDNSDKALERYLELMKQTVERQGFYAHSEKYHRLMWKHLKEAKIANLLVARYDPPSHKASEGQVITTWILFKWKDYLYYPYGAASLEHKNVMANNLMMWEAIRFGKKQKCKYFDLWGREEGKGFTKFKEGYNPEVIEFLGTWDLVFNKPMYYLYRALELFRWIYLRTKSRFVKPRF